MTHSFVTDRVRLFIIGLFVALLFAPGFVLSLVDRFTNPHPADVQSFLSGLAIVFGLGLIWSAWLTLPPIVVDDSTLLVRHSFHQRRHPLEPVTRMQRDQGRGTGRASMISPSLAPTTACTRGSI